MQEDPIILYEKQITYVMAALKQNSTLLDVFNKEEKARFCQYFWPDWVAASEDLNLYRYYQQLIKQDPQFPTQADRLLRHFIKANHLPDRPDLHSGQVGKEDSSKQ